MYHSELREGNGIILGATRVDQLVGKLEACKKGPLPHVVLNAVEELWADVENEIKHLFGMDDDLIDTDWPSTCGFPLYTWLSSDYIHRPNHKGSTSHQITICLFRLLQLKFPRQLRSE
jgi:hypothetical protein